MSRIRIMPENLANQIAAGEVIERPASVVKELLENAIDAGASDISLHVEGNGTRLMRIIDNGGGMDQDDVLLSLERHATSKLSSIDQLGALATLGFRGEALPSIASVSRMTITSRVAGSELGTRVEVHFGRITKVHDMGCSPGTSIEVRDLFGNVPARRKFLKTARTEIAHIEEIVKNYSLARHRHGFILTIDGRTVLSFPVESDSIETRVRRLFGRKPDDALVAIQAEEGGENDAIRIHGFLVPPEEMPSAFRLRTFVNGRAVRDRMIASAVLTGLQGFLMKGRQPAGALFLGLPAGTVDVNVHPAKLEVRFQDSARVHKRIADSVSNAVKVFQDRYRQKMFSLPQKGRGEEFSPEPVSGPEEKSVAGRRKPENHYAESGQDRLPLQSAEEKQYYGSTAVQLAKQQGRGQTGGDFGRGPASVAFKSSADPTDELVKRHSSGGIIKEYSGPGERQPAGKDSLSCRLIGQLLGVYILCETNEGLVLIDQHAAHERLLFESLKKQYESERIPSQALLFPRTIETGPFEREVLERNREEIAKLGYEIEDFGGNTIAVKAIPAVMTGTSAEEAVAGMLASFQAGEEKGGVEGMRSVHDVLSGMACKAAVKSGDDLSPQEMESLLDEMRAADIFSHCPHGRPVMKHVSEKEIQRWFHRTS